MENWNLYANLVLVGILIGAVLGAALAIQISRWRDYREPYYLPREQYDYYGYPRRQHLGSSFLYLIGLIALIVLWLAGSKLRANQASLSFGLDWPALQARTAPAASEPAGRIAYLEFGAYADWDAAQEAKQLFSEESGQQLDVVQCLDAVAPYRVVLGPYRNAAQAKHDQVASRFRAAVAHYE
jgi:hypothetical protein